MQEPGTFALAVRDVSQRAAPSLVEERRPKYIQLESTYSIICETGINFPAAAVSSPVDELIKVIIMGSGDLESQRYRSSKCRCSSQVRVSTEHRHMRICFRGFSQTANPAASTHAGVLEFIAEEGVVHLGANRHAIKFVRVDETRMPCRPSSIALAKFQPKSTTAWLASHYRDPRIKERLSNPRYYRGPSAFRLLEIEATWNRFLSHPDIHAVVDLGAAPGGWTQVVAGKLGWDIPRPTFTPQSLALRSTYKDEHNPWHASQSVEDASTLDPQGMDDIFDPRELLGPWNLEGDGEEETGKGRGKIVSVDLGQMAPIRGAHYIQADFLSPGTDSLIHHALSAKGDNPDGEVDIILSDIAVPTSGNPNRDAQASLRLCHAVFEFARRRLRTAKSIGRKRGGVLMMRHLGHPLLRNFRNDILVPHFHDVRFILPRTAEAGDAYFLCQGWKGAQR